mmetsp:Transcript_20394/g.26298  ORF Transcript_20394/g.26298 Transcript_20394/m.26298 type:complete len:407 (+) Transcript_20394:49-1269(+)
MHIEKLEATVADNNKQQVVDSVSVLGSDDGRLEAAGGGTNSFLVEEERVVREHAHQHDPISLFLMNGYSTVIVFSFHLISLECIIGILVSVILTVYLYEVTDQQNFDGSRFNWVLLTFAAVTPIATSINLAFSRRESALASLGRIRTNAIQLYAAHASWDWGFQADGTTGRSRSSLDSLKHSDQVLEVLLDIFGDLTRYLTLPTSTRARHKVTAAGQHEAKKILDVSAQLVEDIIAGMGKLCDFCEVLKREGLPAQEAIRMRNWELLILQEIELVRMVKRYRTPQGLRSFGRLFSVFLPPLYAPFYVYTARELNSLGVGIAFACFTSVVLSTLFETVFQMEDPFVPAYGLDGIRVGLELLSNFRPRILQTRKEIFPDAPSFEGDSDVIQLIKSMRGQMLGSRILNE